MVPIRDKRKCPVHKENLVRSESCPVQFVYIYPEDSVDRRQWLGGIVRNQKEAAKNLHNHSLHGSTKISQFVKDNISAAESLNPSLQPNDVANGKGIPFVPSAVDAACSHLGKVSREIRRVKSTKGLTSKPWIPSKFEEVAEEIDQEDYKRSGDSQERMKKYKCYGRPYLISAGIENGIEFIFMMTPLMTKIASQAMFIQCDITCDQTQEFPYLINAVHVAFNTILMEWMVIARIRLNKQSADAYALAIKKVFSKCESDCDTFCIGETLLGIIIDWSDAEILGLKQAIGESKAQSLLRGCKVHWYRSCQRVADRVATSGERQRERTVFLKICHAIQELSSSVDIIACFEALCGVRTLGSMKDKLPALLCDDDALFVDRNCDWSAAKFWAQWWTRASHLRMLCKAFSPMDIETWKKCPSTTNAVERKNKDCKSDSKSLKLGMINVYKVDKVVCCKHIAAEEGTSLSYYDRSDEARQSRAVLRKKQRLNIMPDLTARCNSSREYCAVWNSHMISCAVRNSHAVECGTRIITSERCRT